MSIIPNKTPIHLILDGLSEETVDESLAICSGYHRIGPAPIEVRTEYFYIVDAPTAITVRVVEFAVTVSMHIFGAQSLNLSNSCSHGPWF